MRAGTTQESLRTVSSRALASKDRDLWSLVKDIRAAERSHFGGVQYSGGEREQLKAKKLLKRKVFRQAAALEPFPPEQRAVLARECLEQGDRAGARQITALAQAKITYVLELLDFAGYLRALPVQGLCERGEQDVAAPEP